MSRQKKKGNKDDSSDSGIGGAVVAGAAVVGVAALAYGAWKLYDFFASGENKETATPPTDLKPEKKVYDSSDEDSHEVRPHSSGRASFGEHHHSTGTRPPNPIPDAENSLTTQLLHYYNHYVDVSPMAMREVMKVVKDIKIQIARCLRGSEKLRLLNIGTIEEIGSSAEDLMVISPESFDILIPFYLNPEDCVIIEKDTATESKSVSLKCNTTPWMNICDSTKHLCPEHLMNALKDLLTETIVSYRNSAARCTIVMHTTFTVVEGLYASGLKKFSINFLPALFVGERQFVSKHLSDSSLDDVPNGFPWIELLRFKEKRTMNMLGPGVCGHMIVLKLFKAIRLNHPLQFGLLSSYHYKTILYRLLNDQTDAEDWKMSAVSERFIDFLIEVGSCLKERNLPHHFQPGCNLFDSISPDCSQNLAHFINRIVGEHNIASLLKYEYGQL